MRFIRLKLNDYRGIEACEVSFEPTGITIVQGPNEIGKTSLGEAIGLLFEFPDSSKKQKVKAINPVHRDAGPAIELEVESGPYRFTYSKRFHKKPETLLVVTQPAPENLTGREAHDRAEAILNETIDIDLWKALTVRQGDEISQPDLTGQSSLSAALDLAASGHPDDSQTEGLYERVRQKYLLYYTEGGAERKELKEARQIETDIQSGIDDLEQQISELERDIERSSSLQSELSQLATREKEQADSVAGYADVLEKISTLKHALETAELKLESAGKSEQEARRASDERQTLIERVASSTAKLENLREAAGISLTAAKSAESEYEKTQEKLKATEARKTGAEELAKLRRDDYDYYQGRLNLEMLNERKSRIDEARAEASKAEGILAGNAVDSIVLDDIKEAERTLLKAMGRLETGAPSLQLRGLAACELDLDGTTLQLKTDEQKSLTIASETRLTIPGLLEIGISSGSSLEDLTRAAADTQTALNDICRQAGVADPAEARKAFDDRVEAERKLASKQQVEQRDLRDLSYEQLVQKIDNLKTSVPGYLESRVEQPTILEALESAKTEMESSTTSLDEAARELESARQALESARKVREKRNSSLQSGQAEIRVLTDDLEHETERLEVARVATSDKALQEQVAIASATVAEENMTVKTARESLGAENPDRTKELAENAEESLKTTRGRRESGQTELTEVQTRLKLRGEEGLHERLEEARRQLDHMVNDSTALFRRASAARLLFETMHEERDEARRAYVAPLKEAIERLGRLVFDETFQIEIDDNLQIASRTYLGNTVPFDSLSGGTKEQLSLIFRLACCIIMAEDDGTPLILDDALGYTDIVRLKTMGAALARAAREAQIIIFTCMPARYSDVGKAKVVSLG